MKEQSKGEVLTIGVDCKADLTAEGIDVSADGTAFDMLCRASGILYTCIRPDGSAYTTHWVRQGRVFCSVCP